MTSNKYGSTNVRMGLYVIAAALVFLLTIKGAAALLGETHSDRSDGIASPAGCIDSIGSIFDPHQQLALKCSEIYERNSQLLILVNRDNPLPNSYTVSLTSTKSGRFEMADVLYDSLVDMFADGYDAGYDYIITSAYRSNEKQQSLIDEDIAQYMSEGLDYDEAVRKTYLQTMPAGCSEHATGLALDIVTPENIDLNQSLELTAGNQWMRDNCQKYGFIIRYPDGKESITGILYEPWHFRYVGKEAAEFLTEHELTLEEFYALVEEGRSIREK